MPTLLVDIGNTAIKSTLSLGDDRDAPVSVHPATREGVDTLVGEAASRGVRRACVASVVPALHTVLEDALSPLGIAVHRITHATPGLLPHHLDAPDTTGIDRLLAARAAWALHGAGGVGVVVVQAGSAATVDTVSGDGVYLGGCILPGPGLWLQGLQQAACLGTLGVVPGRGTLPPPSKGVDPVPRVPVSGKGGIRADLGLAEARDAILDDAFPECRRGAPSPLPCPAPSPDPGAPADEEPAALCDHTRPLSAAASPCGGHTRAAIALGLQIGWRGAVAAVVEAQRGMGGMPVVVTGGWACALRGELPPPTHHHPHLVLEGLRLVQGKTGDGQPA